MVTTQQAMALIAHQVVADVEAKNREDMKDLDPDQRDAHELVIHQCRAIQTEIVEWFNIRDLIAEG